MGTTDGKVRIILDIFLWGKLLGLNLLSAALVTMNRCIISTCFRSCIQGVTFESIAVVIGRRNIFWIVSGVNHDTLFCSVDHTRKILIIDIIKCKLFMLLILSGHRTELSSYSRRWNHLLINPYGHVSWRIQSFMLKSSLWPTFSILEGDALLGVECLKWLVSIECWNRCLIKFDFKFWISFCSVSLWFKDFIVLFALAQSLNRLDLSEVVLGDHDSSLHRVKFSFLLRVSRSRPSIFDTESLSTI